MAAVDLSLVRRSAIALGVSVALHAFVLFMVRTKPPTLAQAGASPIVAWIEHSAEPAQQAEQTPEVSDPVPDAQASVAAPPPVATADTAVEASKPPAHPAVAPAPATQARPADTPAGLEIPLSRDPTYYPLSALDQLPMLLGSAEACYPEGATGEVAFLLLIDDTGTVNEVSVLEVKPQGLFTMAAVEACRGLKFTPARKDGRAVRSRVRLVVGAKPMGSALP